MNQLQVQVVKPSFVESLPIDFFDESFQDAEVEEISDSWAGKPTEARVWVSKAMIIVGEASVALVLLASPTRFF